MALRMPAVLTKEQRDALAASKKVKSFGGYRESNSPNGEKKRRAKGKPSFGTDIAILESPAHDPAKVLAEIGHINFDTDEAMRLMEHDEWIGLDIETSGLSPFNDAVAVISMYGDRSKVPTVLHLRGYLPERLRAWMSDPKRNFICHNAVGFDAIFLAQNGIPIDVPGYYCSLVGEGVNLKTQRNDIRVSLAAAVKRRLGQTLDKSTGLATSPWMAERLTDGQIAYCANDIRFLPRLRDKQLEEVARDSRAKAMEIEQAILPTVGKMVLNGLPINQEAWRRYRGEQQTRFMEAQTSLRQQFGDINFNSHPKALKVFQDLGAPITDTKKATMTALQEFADDELQQSIIVEARKLINDGRITESQGATNIREAQQNYLIGEMAKHFLILRGSGKRLSMYSDDWWRKYVFNGRVHARFWQVGTETGRFSSSDPNLQQQSNDARYIYQAEEGYAYISADYSQIEVRLMAAWAQDAALLGALEEGDIHSAVAAQIFVCDPSEVTVRMRKLAKAAVFCLLFGGSAKTLHAYARLSGSKLSIEEANDIVKRFFLTFLGVAAKKKWAQTMASVNRAFTIELPHGLQRVLVENSLSPNIILNTTVQGSAASGLKYALLETGLSGVEDYMGAVCHDEIIAHAPLKDAREIAGQLEKDMLEGMRKVTAVTVKVETKVGRFWGDDSYGTEA
jgi:DNA polymerase-1